MIQQPRYWRATGGYQDAPIRPPAPPPALTWRANGGYQDATKGPTPQQSQQQSPQMYWPSWYCTQWAGQQYVRGPVPMNGVYSWPAQEMPPPNWAGSPYGWAPWTGPSGGTPPPPYFAPPAPAAEAQQEEMIDEGKKQDKKAEDKEEKEVDNADAPPNFEEGVNYMFDKGHTMLHIFNKAARVWEEKYHKQELKFKIFKTPTSFTPKLIIEKVLRKEGDECKGWQVTEVHERGDGVWAKGVSIEHTSDIAGNALPKFGWSTKRGDSLPPVWLVVHKV